MKSLIAYIVGSKVPAWIVLALPAPALLADFFTSDRYYAELMYESGVLGTQLLVFALLISPLVVLFNQVAYVGAVLRWLLLRRRAIGVASFCYAALHTAFYVRHAGSFELILLDLPEKELAIGWLAFLLLAALAATSNQTSIRWLGPSWKKLQRGAYAVAAMVALHWLWVGQFLTDLALWTAILLAIRLAGLSLRSLMR